MAIRFVGAVVLGGIVTLALLMLMRAVITHPEATVDDASTGHVVELVKVQEDQDVVEKPSLDPPPPPPDQPPPDLPPPSTNRDTNPGVEIGRVIVDTDFDIGPAGGFSSDGDYLPIIKVNPIYPRRALSRGIEGYVLLKFVVTETGSVRDPVVIEAEPPNIFDRAAKNAALKFKYKPKMVDGKPVAVSGVPNRIIFQLKEKE